MLLDLTPAPKPRDYTICSGAACNPGVIALSVAMQAGGCASEFLQSLSCGDRVTVAARPSSFAVAARGLSSRNGASAQSKPLVLVGGGTGIAPFRGLLEDCRTHSTPGKIAGLFGFRSADHMIYDQELREHVGAGRLQSLDIALSASQDSDTESQSEVVEPGVHLHHSAYVHDIVDGRSTAGLGRAEVFRLLDQEEASVWVCGPRQMGEAFELALERCASHLLPHERVQWLKRLRDQDRIVTELWG